MADTVTRRWASGLSARYDAQALRVELPAAAPAPDAARPDSRRSPAWPLLQAWCFAGAGDGRSPFWQPSALPRVEQRFTLALLTGKPQAQLASLAEAYSRHIDGSDQLAALRGGAARIGLRLRVKLCDALWWRARRPADPWDSGYLVDEVAALQALRSFLPRRATLLVAVDLPAAALQERIALLARRSAGFAHPVRLLVVGPEAQPHWREVTVIVDR